MELRATTLWMSRLGPEGERDEQLGAVIERAIAGDVSAFEEIVVRYERLTLAGYSFDVATLASLIVPHIAYQFQRVKSYPVSGPEHNVQLGSEFECQLSKLAFEFAL